MFDLDTIAAMNAAEEKRMRKQKMARAAQQARLDAVVAQSGKRTDDIPYQLGWTQEHDENPCAELAVTDGSDRCDKKHMDTLLIIQKGSK